MCSRRLLPRCPLVFFRLICFTFRCLFNVMSFFQKLFKPKHKEEGDGSAENMARRRGKKHQNPGSRSGQKQPPVKAAELYLNGLINQGATCYLNSVLQVLYMTGDFRERVQSPHSSSDSRFIDSCLRSVFKTLQKSTASTEQITRHLGIRDVSKQQDAAECLEKILSCTSPEASQIFEGVLTQKSTCAGCKTQTISSDPFWSLPLTLLAIKDKYYSVTDGIKNFFEPTQVDGDNQLYCEKCKTKENATLQLEMKKRPDVLTLLLKRFKFDYTHMRYVKVSCGVEIPPKLQIPPQGDLECQEYELYAYVEHRGELRHGHYTVMIKYQLDAKWYIFNDSKVFQDYQPFQLDRLERSQNAYLLFYRKLSINSEENFQSSSEDGKLNMNGRCEQNGNNREEQKAEEAAVCEYKVETEKRYENNKEVEQEKILTLKNTARNITESMREVSCLMGYKDPHGKEEFGEVVQRDQNSQFPDPAEQNRSKEDEQLQENGPHPDQSRDSLENKHVYSDKNSVTDSESHDTPTYLTDDHSTGEITDNKVSGEAQTSGTYQQPLANVVESKVEQVMLPEEEHGNEIYSNSEPDNKSESEANSLMGQKNPQSKDECTGIFQMGQNRQILHPDEQNRHKEDEKLQEKDLNPDQSRDSLENKYVSCATYSESNDPSTYLIDDHLRGEITDNKVSGEAQTLGTYQQPLANVVGSKVEQVTLPEEEHRMVIYSNSEPDNKSEKQGGNLKRRNSSTVDDRSKMPRKSVDDIPENWQQINECPEVQIVKDKHSISRQNEENGAKECEKGTCAKLTENYSLLSVNEETGKQERNSRSPTCFQPEEHSMRPSKDCEPNKTCFHPEDSVLQYPVQQDSTSAQETLEIPVKTPPGAESSEIDTLTDSLSDLSLEDQSDQQRPVSENAIHSMEGKNINDSEADRDKKRKSKKGQNKKSTVISSQGLVCFR